MLTLPMALIDRLNELKHFLYSVTTTFYCVIQLDFGIIVFFLNSFAIDSKLSAIQREKFSEDLQGATDVAANMGDLYYVFR